MGLDFEHQKNKTHFSDEEKEGLLIPSVTTRAELDEVEQQNIEEAVRWTLERRRKFSIDEIFSEAFVCNLHRRMYGHVWEWAGQFRKTNKNIGIDFFQIPIALRALLDDSKYWLATKQFDDDETAVRFKHRIVAIHCFSNGNGRHSRLMGDLIAEKIFGRPVFSWGATDLIKQNDFRKIYIASLQAADRDNYQDLIRFARS